MGEAICLPIIGFSILQIRNCAPERSCARVLHHPHQSGRRTLPAAPAPSAIAVASGCLPSAAAHHAWRTIYPCRAIAGPFKISI